MKAKKVLIFPAGTEIAFEIVNALKYSKFVELYGGTSVDDHSEFVYKKLIKGFPYIDQTGFLEFLNRVVDTYSIDCIYPAHDSASVFLSKFSAKIQAQVIITDIKTTEICRSKSKTYEHFKGESFIPQIYFDAEEINSYPVFVKPSIGQGSVGVKKINSKLELDMALSENDALIICEYLSGMEYTIDCLTDKDGQLRVVKIRDRQRTRAGISVRSQEYVVDDEILHIANTINSSLKFKGAWFFQVKKNQNNEYKLMEISPRIPGTMGLSRNLGINFPMLTLFTFWGYPIEIIDNGYDILLDRAFYNAYRISYNYTHIYIDFDDTITLNKKVNPDVMRYMYQAKNSGKHLHILSRHEGNIFEDLERLCISQKIFDDIIVLSANEEKYDYITENDAIFIDDSFTERKKVFDKKGIPVFDVDMVEGLIDWRN